MKDLTDNALMLKVKSGNTELLGLLYERYKKWLYNFFFQINYDTGLSEDLVQNVFMRILKYKHTYTEDSKFTTWIFQIARNESHDHYNKNVKNKEAVDLSQVAYKLSGEKSVQHELEKKEEVTLLNQAIEKLPQDKREIIVLSKLKQLQYKEIGNIIGCSEGSARIKAHRALQDLKTTYLAMQKY